ncbi:MAG: hypothetical protein LBM02_09825 [Lachnospiraceae bacterium]|jgi:hypothetical protein|nr:hypothetical protein [Lachnospiraceae bacterium]
MKISNYVYDLETYPNFFCGVFKNKMEERVFEISGRKNDLDLLYKFYNSKNIKYLIGFNCVRFDAQIMQFLVDNYEILRNLSALDLNQKIFDKAQEVIRKSNNNEFLPYPEWKITVPQIDLYLINHYNNKNKATSLKWIEFSINYPKVQDLPFKFDLILSPKNFDTVIQYCINDVNATRMFAKEKKNLDLINLRLSQDEQYPELRLLNKSDSSVGETLFLKFMSESMNIDMKELKTMRTHRDTIEIQDILLPYINFKTPEFQSVFDFYNFNTYGIQDSKGDTIKLKKTVHYKGIDYEFSEGGLHASWENKIFEADSNYEIWDWDVESYYPNLAIVNGYKPEHLGEHFTIVYRNIFLERKKYPKGTTENYSFKIILNGTYGKLGDMHSFLYDIKPQLQICINGQLLLAMLCERFSLVDGCTIIQANTDGVTVRIRKDKIEEMKNIAAKWEKLTSLRLENAEYSKMVISNVNNYIAQYTNGKIKYKGSYEIDRDFHKNKSQRIVQIALKRYFIDNIPIEDTVMNHLNVKGGYDHDNMTAEYAIHAYGIYDFCHGRKVKWNQEFVMIQGMNEKRINEKVIRYYNTTKKSMMMKKYSDGRIEAVNKGYNAELFQNFEEKTDYMIDYNYYLNECYKITTLFGDCNPKVGKQLSLFE